MTELEDIEKAIVDELPPFLQSQAKELATLLLSIIRHSITEGQVNEAIKGNGYLNQAISSLIGKEIKSPEAVITFGKENSFQNVNIGDVAQGNIFKITINFPSTSSSSNLTKQETLRLQVHKAYFTYSPMECVFVNTVNMCEKEIEITHIWFATNPPIHVLNPNRPLPKRLRPDEAWETWIETYKLPAPVQFDPYNLARARLSTGIIITSSENQDVPTQGFVPGGPITIRIMRLDADTSDTGTPYFQSLFSDLGAIELQSAGVTATDYTPAANPLPTKPIIKVSKPSITPDSLYNKELPKRNRHKKNKRRR